MALPAGGEPKLGVIPRFVKYAFGGMREYSILLTDRRFIFVLASLNRMFLVAAAIGGAIGAAIAAPAARDATGESESYIFKDDPDTLASMPDSLVIRYDGLRRLLLKKYPADYELDRKSTRLNSSHGSISYAVFCLKKKKKLLST